MYINFTGNSKNLNESLPDNFPMCASTMLNVSLLLLAAAMITAASAGPPSDIAEPQIWRAQLIDGFDNQQSDIRAHRR